MSCCGVSKCPDTNPDILRQLCDLWYPYGGAVCKHMFERWYQEEQEVRDLHQEYLNSKKSKVIHINSLRAEMGERNAD